MKNLSGFFLSIFLFISNGYFIPSYSLTQADLNRILLLETSKTDKLNSADNNLENLLSFWDRNLSCDNQLPEDKETLTSLFSQYASLLNDVTEYKQKEQSVITLFDKINNNQSQMLRIEEVANKLFYNPESPYYNEESFIPFMKFFSQSELIDRPLRDRYKFRLDIAQKNRPGSKAANFKFVTREGEKKSLYNIKAQNRVLLIFYDPDCQSCKETIDFLATDDNLNSLIKNGELTLLAIYSGEDKELWDSTKDELPSCWIVGYEPGDIDEKDLYFFRSFPSLYLLDGNKKVLRKDLKLLPH